MEKLSSFFSRGVFGVEERSGQDVAEYLFFIGVLVGIIWIIKGTIQAQFQAQAAKLFQTG
jgi:hypothetical protein